jgi:hypothetical protein
MKTIAWVVVLLAVAALIYFRVKRPGMAPAAAQSGSASTNARANHFDKLRHLLAHDADKFEEVARTVREQGYYAPLAEEPPDGDDSWYPQLLYRDLSSHFSRFASDRERLRERVRTLDAGFRTLMRHVEDQFNLPHALRERSEVVALSSVRHCLGKGAVPRLEQTATSYSFSTGLGGSEDSDTHGPPASLAAAFSAYERFRPDAAFGSTCAGLGRQAVAIEQEARRLAAEAKQLAAEPVSAFRGDCPYLPRTF